MATLFLIPIVLEQNVQQSSYKSDGQVFWTFGYISSMAFLNTEGKMSFKSTGKKVNYNWEQASVTFYA